MTKKKLFIGASVIVFIWALFQFNLIETIVIFLLVGSLPGISWSLSPIMMYGLLGLGIAALAYFVATHQIYPGSPRMRQHRDAALRRTARRRVARARAKRQATHSEQNMQHVNVS